MDRSKPPGGSDHRGIVDVENFLQHYGVKGMKWGVRNAEGTNGDFVVGKENPIYNISAEKPRDAKGQVYAAFTKNDVVNYRAFYSQQLTVLNGASKVFSNSFDLKSELKVAGEKAQHDAFKKLWEKDKNGIAKALAKSQVDISVTAAIVNRVFKIDRTNAYEKKFREASEDYMLTKGFKQFQSALGVPGNNFKTPYYSLLAKRGYSALLDLNDMKAMGSEKPILIFKGKDVLRNKKSLELTKSDIQLAMDAYFDKKKSKNYNVDELHTKHAEEGANQMSEVENFLQHYGVPGMKWGKRKNPGSVDSNQSVATRANVKKLGVHTVSNADLKAAIKRMQLEQDFKRLSVNEKSAVTRWVSSTLLEIGKREVQTRTAKKAAGIVIKKAATGGVG